MSYYLCSDVTVAFCLFNCVITTPINTITKAITCPTEICSEASSLPIRIATTGLTKVCVLTIAEGCTVISHVSRAKNHTDETIKKAQDFIEHNIQEKMTIEELAALTSVGRRSFERRFKIATNNSVLEYINRVKIESAKRNFENSRKTLTK